MMILQLVRRILSHNKVVSLCDFLRYANLYFARFKGLDEEFFYKQNHAKGR